MELLLKNLEIDGFRGINKLRMEGLGRVNLLVGRNNSGKTRVLDALRVLSERASPLVLSQISREHDEYHDSDGGRVKANGANFLRYFFNDRTLPSPEDKKTIRISDGERIEFKIHHLAFIEEEIEENDGTRLIRTFIASDKLKDVPPDTETEYSIVSTTIENQSKTSRNIIALFDKERDELVMQRGFSLLRGIEPPKTQSFKFIPSSFLNHDELAFLWDRIVLGDKEKIVVEMMQAIDLDISGIAFIGETSRRDRHPIVRMRGSEPVPLGSLGDGVYRIFQLALNLVNAEGGILLIDEFENGFHFRLQANVWKLIFDFSKKLNIQIFASTHSNDCITAFAEAATNHPELGCVFHLGQSIIDGSTIATRYEEARLKELVDMGRDIR